MAIVLALGMPADIYLIDEPSACELPPPSQFSHCHSHAHIGLDLDSEQRIVASRVIKRFIMHAKKTAFIVEHDFIMATYLADRVIVFDGQPGINAHANKPESLLTGCNTFLKNLDVTFRRDPTNFRPRINKANSQLDQEQKLSGNYVGSSGCLASFWISANRLTVLPGRPRKELLKRAFPRIPTTSTTAAPLTTMHLILAF